MNKLNNEKLLIYNDCNYIHAVNYQHMYNAPITLNFGAKHDRSKYIISSGNSDSITLMQDGIFIYVVSKNRLLNYIGMEVINTESKRVEESVFLTGDDLDLADSFSYDLLNKDIDEQIKIMSEYCY